MINKGFILSSSIYALSLAYCKHLTDIRNETCGILSLVYVILAYSYSHTDSNGKEEKGILLYGLNSSGKSSFQKSVGLSIILAQSGMYVPARKFSFSPYRYLFTRIDGNDNLFRGLSSFTLEMMDLKNILKYASKNTLIIGDEVCKGTEYLSANSILASTIITLAKSESSFIFASHLHDIPKLDRIKTLKNVKSYHLEVRHSTELNCLVFERTLKEGQGEEIYGILVAHDIIGDLDFNELVNTVKNDILEQPNNVVRNKTSNYNREVWVNECAICKERVNSEEYHSHHINFQKNCEGGFVKEKPHIPMNSKMNLVILCEKCHQNLHSGKIKIEGYVQTSKGKNIKR
jgi:DNA mismatch repair protein MutS